jgi:hypothetical protein
MRQGHKKPNTQENQQHHACHDKQNLADADASGYLPTVQARLLVGRHIMPALPTLDMRYRNGHAGFEFFHRIPPAGCKCVAPSKIKKPTWPNTLRRSAASAYSATRPPAIRAELHFI